MDTPPIFLSAPLIFEALQPDGEQLPTKFSGVAYSGEVIQDYGYPFIIDLASTEIAAPMPLLFQHDDGRIIGSIDDAKNSQSDLTVSGSLFSDIDACASDVARKSKRGVPYQMSVGLYGASYEDVPANSAPVNVNGRSVSGPITILRRGRVRECSVVALGADPQTSAAFFSRGGQAPQPTEGNPMSDPATVERITALESQVQTLTAQLAESTARAEQAEAQLAAQSRETRLAAVKELFSSIGRAFSDEAAAPYLDLSAMAFDVISADLRAAKPKAPAHLFSQQTQGDPSQGKPDVTLNPSAIYAARGAKA